MDLLSADEAAVLLDVSAATVRNWEKAGHLPAAGHRPLAFARAEVLLLQERIRTNRFSRLRQRANKRASRALAEAAGGSDSGESGFTAAARRAEEAGLTLPVLLYLLALRLLETEDEVSAGTAGWEPEDLTWRRPAAAEAMRGLRQSLPGNIPGYDRRFCSELLAEYGAAAGGGGDRDVLGTVYQGFSTAGKRSLAGAFFTPWEIIDDALASFSRPPASFLDPCCGTGRYLIRAADHFGLGPDRLYGFDSDPVSAGLARLGLLLRFRDWNGPLQIHCLDSLHDSAGSGPESVTARFLETADAIATNPPWGGSKNPGRRSGPETTGDTFSLFLEKSLRLLRPGGILSFILPESFLQIKAHAGIRRLLAETSTIRRITLLGRIFPGVFTSVIRLDCEKCPPPPDWHTDVAAGENSCRCRQERFPRNAGCIFDVSVTPSDERLIGKIYAVRHRTLAGYADWALGIVTGDNARYVLSAPGEGTEPVLRGRDIFKFTPREPRCHIVYRPERFQQSAPEKYFRAPEKLIYRFISSRLVFARDTRGLLTLNSANILIPRIPDLPVRAAMAFLNSRVFQYLFLKRFRTRKILRSDLETLPFPVCTPELTARIERQTEVCMGGEYGPADELDQLVYEAFGLSREDAAVLEKSLREETGREFY